jgi:methyl-accepting chemotaxis protein
MNSMDGVVFMIIQDLNGYAPAQNSQGSVPCTGDQSNDYNSRVKRMTTDQAQVRAARMGLTMPNTAPLCLTGETDVRNRASLFSRSDFVRAGLSLEEPSGGDWSVLLQTTARRTNIVNLLAVPLYIKGHRYGALMLGWIPKT